MLTMNDILAQIADVPFATGYFMDDLCHEFDLVETYDDDSWRQFEARVSIKPIKTWICTDTLVGFFAVYFDGEFVAFAHQPYRKSSASFAWVSRDAAVKARDFMIEITTTKPTDEFKLLAPTEDYTQAFADFDANIAQAEEWRRRGY